MFQDVKKEVITEINNYFFLYSNSKREWYLINNINFIINIELNIIYIIRTGTFS